jgi:hypothetical protein
MLTIAPAMQLNNYKIVLSSNTWISVTITTILILRDFQGIIEFFSDKSATYLPNAKEYSKQVTTTSKTNCIGLEEEFEDTKGVIRIRISKNNRQHNDQKKKYKRTNNDLQNIHIKLKIKLHELH